MTPQQPTRGSVASTSTAGTTASPPAPPTTTTTTTRRDGGDPSNNNTSTAYSDDGNSTTTTSSSSSASSLGRRRPLDTPFRQQRVASWHPSMSPVSIISAYFIVGVAFLAVGVVVLRESQHSPEVYVSYDQRQPCPFADRQPPNDYACTPLNMSLHVTTTLHAPVFMYYELDGFYQNNRGFASSISTNQLSNYEPLDGIHDDCKPLEHPGQYGPSLDSDDEDMTYFDSHQRASLKSAIYSPCGLIAWAMFNDSFTLYKRHDSSSSNRNSSSTSNSNGSGSALSSLAMPSAAALRTESDSDDDNEALTLICDGAAFSVYDSSPTRENQQCRKRGITWSTDPYTRFTPPPNTSQWLTHSGWSGACDQSNSNSNSNDNGNVSSSSSSSSSSRSGGTSSSGANPYSVYACNGWYIGEVGHRIPATMDEDFMVWARTSTLRKFRKLYRVIETDLQPGSYLLTVYQRFDVSGFNGHKAFVLVSSRWISKNYYLAGLYLGVGGLCVLLALGFFIQQFVIVVQARNSKKQRDGEEEGV